MNKHALFHEAKSEYSYQYDEKKLHILFRTAKNDCDSVSLSYGDPFDWDFNDGKASWKSNLVKMERRYSTELFDYYFIEIEPVDYRCKYSFLIEDNNKFYFYGSKRLVELDNKPANEFDEGSFYDLSNYYNYPYLNKEDLNQTPSWVKDTVWYQIFMDRFDKVDSNSTLKWGKLPVKNSEIYGGNIKGVIQRLPYLKELGITGIYFTPIFKAPSAHKYDTVDYYQIDPSFGTNEEFKLLVKEAHKLGIKVVLDGVLNHCGWGHPYFQDVVKNGKTSKYFDAFFFDKEPYINFEIDAYGNPANTKNIKPNYRTFAYTPMMPKWNTDNELAKEHLLGVIEYWIKNYNIDGWRLDVANEISHDFLREIKKTARKAKKSSFIFGENWDSSLPWLKGDQMDSVMNYDLTIPIWQYFDGKTTLEQFKNELIQYTALTPKNAMENMFNQLDTHDTVRMLHRVNENPQRLKIAYTLMFASQGAPNIYYGSEVGLTGAHDPDNRRCFNWDESTWDLNIYKMVKLLIKLRNKHTSFKSSDYHFIDQKSMSFIKEDKNETLMFLINDSKLPHQINIDKKYNGTYLNIENNKFEMVYDKLVLNPYEIKIYLVRKENVDSV